MEQKPTLTEAFNDELRAHSSGILNKDYQRKRIRFWFIRIGIVLIFYILLWRYPWVRMSLYFTVPLSLLSLSAIVIMPWFLKKKIERTKIRLKAVDDNAPPLDEATQD